MRKILPILALMPTLALAAPPMPAAAGAPPCDGRHHFRHPGGEPGQLPPFLQGLDLTDAQQAEIKKLQQAAQTDNAASHAEMRKNHQALRDLSFSDSYSDAQAAALQDKAAALHKDKMLKKAKLDNSIYKLLTAEQKQKLKTSLDQSGAGDFPGNPAP